MQKPLFRIRRIKILRSICKRGNAEKKSHVALIAINVMNTSDIFKDIGSVWTRLFDHKLFLHGEIQFSLREYEQKRNDIEVDHLFSLLEKVADVKVTQINRLKESVDFSLLDVDKSLKEALAICNLINDLESTYQQDSATELARNSRKVEWEKFIDSMSVHCEEIDSTFEQKEQELEKLYLDLENKLSVTSIPSL